MGRCRNRTGVATDNNKLLYIKNMITQIILMFAVGMAGSVIGAASGAGAVLYKVGKWQGGIEHRIKDCEKRLDSGSTRVRDVPVLQSQVDRLVQVADKFEQMYVTKSVCDERHKQAG